MKHLFVLLFAGALVFSLRAEPAGSLAQNFQLPPAAARPWVYWFWNNGNVTSNGITADLEAMQRVGIGGVLIMDVLERFAPPRGTAEFMNPEWQRLFEFSVQEAARLGLKINMANGPGWCGSSGPWITPELSMQKLVWTNLVVTGPANFSVELPQPALDNRSHGHFYSEVQFKDYYEDIALLAFPATNGMVPASAVVDLSAKLGADGKFTWAVPPGEWILQRIGHTTTGSSTRPPVAGGNGLECDKLSRTAMDAQFAGMMAKLIKTAGPLAGKSLVATHIDSWEVGSQNWTPLLRQEFKSRRGYDPLPWLPCVTDATRAKVNGKMVVTFAHDLDNAAMAARFRWDFDQTIAELLAENYSGRLAELAHQHGLRYTLEGYALPFGDEFTYAARADEPMAEFWTASNWGKAVAYQMEEMASVAHVYGHAIFGAEAFTSEAQEAWKLAPADIKSLGDYAFSQGVNRFVVHRYAHQPYLDRAPGATMGPYGLHYERTQTWWEMSGAWHEYVTRCQYLLRQGNFVADLLYLRPEEPNQVDYFVHRTPPAAGYRFDEISAEALRQRASVRDGRIVLPDGMSYRVLVLPPAGAMTPALLEKIRELAKAGATVVATGPRPQNSPSLQDFPKCDDAVAKLGREIWGKCDGKSVIEAALGKGKLVWGQSPEKVLASLNVPVDFAANVNLNWIHRRVDGAEIYFVANPSNTAVETRCTFRVKGLRPELWNPETGEIFPLAACEETAAGVTVPLRFDPSGSAFIVFRQSSEGFDPVVKILRNGQPLPEPLPKIDGLKIVRASYGVPGDAQRTRDVRDQVQALVNDGQTSFKVADLAAAGDPAYSIVKTLSVEYVAGGKTFKAAGKDPDTIALGVTLPASERPAEILCDAAGHVRLAARQPGSYEWITASGQTNRAEITEVTPPIEISGPWQLSFPPKWGAPESVTLTNLISWSDSADDGVKHFSGTATYRTTFDFSNSKLKTENSKLFLTLRDVQVMARVKVNGQDCGVAWRPPFRVEITGAVRHGENSLEIQVANLWPNRLIGDAALPEEKRFTWSSWEPFKRDMPLLQSGLIGPVCIEVQE